MPSITTTAINNVFRLGRLPFASLLLKSLIRHPPSCYKLSHTQPCATIGPASSALMGKAMGLLVVYIGLVVLGDVAAYFIGLSGERYWPQLSLATFLFLYFAFLWV